MLSKLTPHTNTTKTPPGQLGAMTARNWAKEMAMQPIMAAIARGLTTVSMRAVAGRPEACSVVAGAVALSPDIQIPFLPNFMSHNTDLTGPLTIFVNGNLMLGGNTTLGTTDNPVALIATGNISCNGTPTINGLAWANGTFGGGTPNFNGSVRCQVVGSFQGNPQLTWHEYDDELINPPDFTDMWKEGSWELL